MTEERVGRKRGGAEHRHLAARQRRQLGQRAFRDADSDVGHHQARERQLGDPTQRSLQSTVLEDAEGALVGTKTPSALKSWLPVPAQAGDRPACRRSRCRRGAGPSVRKRRDTTIVDQAVTDELFGVLAAAGKRPLARDEVPAVDGCGGVRRLTSRADHVRRFSVDHVERFLRELPGDDEVRLPIIPSTQRSRRLSARSRSIWACVGRSAFTPPRRRGREHPEATRGAELLHEISRYAACLLDLLAPADDGGYETADRRGDRCGVRLGWSICGSAAGDRLGAHGWPPRSRATFVTATVRKPVAAHIGRNTQILGHLTRGHFCACHQTSQA